MAENTEKKTTQQQPEAQETNALSDEQLDMAGGGAVVTSGNTRDDAADRPTQPIKVPGKLEIPNLTFHLPEPD